MITSILGVLMPTLLAHARSIDFTCRDEKAGVTVVGGFEKSDGYYVATSDLVVTAPEVRKTFVRRAVGVKFEDHVLTLEARLTDGSSIRIHHREDSVGDDHLAMHLRGAANGEFVSSTNEGDCEFARRTEN